MAGIYYPIPDTAPELVTLTTSPSNLCKQYHHRMPLLIPENAIEDFLTLPVEDIGGLLVCSEDSLRVSIGLSLIHI